MINMTFLIEDRSWTRKLLVEICLIGLSVIDNGDHVRVVEGQMIWPTSDDRTFCSWEHTNQFDPDFVAMR